MYTYILKLTKINTWNWDYPIGQVRNMLSTQIVSEVRLLVEKRSLTKGTTTLPIIGKTVSAHVRFLYLLEMRMFYSQWACLALSIYKNSSFPQKKRAPLANLTNIIVEEIWKNPENFPCMNSLESKESGWPWRNEKQTMYPQLSYYLEYLFTSG